MSGSRHRLQSILPLIAVGLLSSSAAASPRVGLVPVERINVSEPDMAQLTGRLADALQARLAVEVQAGDRLDPAPTIACTTDAACIQRVAAGLEADQLLFLIATRVGAVIQVETVWAEAGTGRSENRTPFQIAATTSDREVADIASGLLPAAPRRVRRSSARNVAIWVTGGVGLVSAGAAVAVGLTALDLESDHDASGVCGRDPVACQRSRERVERRALTADLLAVGAAASLATSLVLYLTRPNRVYEPAVTPTPGGVVMSLTSRF